MARQALPIVGAVFGGQVGFVIGSIIGNLVDPERIKGPRLEELPVTSTTEGAFRSVVYGTCVVRNCQLIDWGPLEDETVDQQQGKGGGPVVEEQRLYQTYAIGIGEGPITGIRYIKVDGKMVYDVRPGSTIMAESSKWAQMMRVYLGGEDQLPDPDLEAIHGVGETPYYRGTAYLVMVRHDLTDYGGRIPTFEVEVAREGVAEPVETVDMVEYDIVATAGGTNNPWIYVNEAVVTARAFTGVVASLISNDGPAYVRVYASEAAGGALLWESGWMGDTGDQLALSTALAAAVKIRTTFANGDPFVDVDDPTLIGIFRTALNGSITGTSSESGYFVPLYGIYDGIRVQVIRANVDASASAQLRLYEPDPEEVDEPYIALPEVPGALYGLTTGTTWFTEYADGVGAVTAAGVTQAYVIGDIADRCGVPAGSTNFSAVAPDVLDGVTLGGPYNGADSIRTFMPMNFFDIVQPEKILLAVKRGGAVKATISEADFVEAPDENVLRGQDIEYPRQLMVKYLNPGQNYAAPGAVASRTTGDVRVTGESTIELPVAMDETAALRVADRILKVMWEDLNGEITFSLPAGPFAWLTPTDCLGLSLRGGLYRIRVESVEESAGVLTVTARRDRQSAYTSTLTAIPLPEPEGPPPTLAGPTLLRVLNMPGIIFDDDRLGVRLAIGAVLPGWSGATVQYSLDDGANWITLGTYTSRSVMGYLTDALPYASALSSDWQNALAVQLYDDTALETVTLTELLSRRNAAAILKADNTVEIVQFQTATDEGGNAWTLGDRLLRGRLETTPADHVAGATFVTLESTVFVELPPAAIGREILLRAVSAGTSPEVAAQIPFTWNPVTAQTEFPVAHLRADRAGGNLGVSWIRRHRFGTNLAPIPSANATGYRVTATDGTTTTTVETTADNLGQADVFTGPVDVTVEPLNRITGAGPATELEGIT